MAGLSNLLEILMSTSVDFAGNGAVRGGKGILMAGARKIGWASGGSNRQGSRFAGHSLAGKSLGKSGLSRRPSGALGSYDPAKDYQARTQDPYRQALTSGTGVARFGGPAQGTPSHLFGRPGFNSPTSPLGREGGRWCKDSTRGTSNRPLLGKKYK